MNADLLSGYQQMNVDLFSGYLAIGHEMPVLHFLIMGYSVIC
jgi:hypothetical protein